MNALERYFENTGTNVSALAAKIGCAVSTLTRPLAGMRNVSMDVAIEVEKATDAQVSASEFMTICLAAKKQAASTEAA
jgi:plasmid maintenance system antidote protein VapI